MTRFFTILFFIGMFNAWSIQPTFYDFSDDFLTYSNNLFIPTSEKVSTSNIINFAVLPQNHLNKNNLQIYNPDFFSVFIDNKLYGCFNAGDTANISLANFNKQFLLSIYSSHSLKNIKAISKCSQFLKSNYTPIIDQPTFYQVRINKKEITNRYLIGIIIVLLLLAVIKVSTPEMNKYIYGLFVAGSFSSRGALLRKDGVMVVVFIIILFTTMIFIFTPSLDADILFFNAINTYRMSVIIIYIVFLTFINIFLHNIFGNLYRIPKLSRTYSIELLFILMVLIFLLIPFYCIVFTPFYVPLILSSQIFDYSVWLIFTIMIINELYFFYGRHHIRKIYIISYICICDIIPFIISYKIVKDFQIA